MTVSSATTAGGTIGTTSGGTITAAGLGSGLNINSIVDGLMSVERQPQNALKTKVADHQNSMSVYQALNTKFASILSAAQTLNLGTNWKVNKATSSDASVTASADSTAISGTLSFVVKNLATTQTMASFGNVASTSTVVGSGQLVLGTAGVLGLGNLASSGLANGAHTVAVTQSSAGAGVKGAAVADSTTLTGSETLQATVDGQAKSYTLTAGTYTQQQLAQMVNTVSGGALNVSVNSDKSLQVSTAHEGSAASMSIDGGTGLTALGLSTSGTVNGTDGIVTVDGTATTVSDVQPNGGNSVTLNAATGSLTASFSGGLRTGTATVNAIDLGDGKLSTVVNNINAAGVGITAAAVQVAPNQYKLQMQSNTTGSAGAIAGGFNAFAGTLGQMQTIGAAQDAHLQVGSGAGAYTITSSSNSISGALPGVTMNLTSADPTKTVTVSVGGDGGSLADKVQALVSSANDALNLINTNSKYDTSTKTAGALLGNFAAQTLQQQLHSAISDGLSNSSFTTDVSLGITSQADGSFSFNRDTFLAAYQKDPNGVASAFVEGGTTSITTHTSPGIAERLAKVGKNATDPVSGIITTSLTGENTSISDLNKQIADWDLRLQQTQATLMAEFNAMDTAVAGFKSTQSWLTGQITNLTANG